MGNIDKVKVLIIAAMVLSVLLVGYMIVDYFVPDAQTEHQGVAFAAPDIEVRRASYDSKLDAYRELKEERQENPVEVINPFVVDIGPADTTVSKTISIVPEKVVYKEKKRTYSATPDPEETEIMQRTPKRLAFSNIEKKETLKTEPMELLVRFGDTDKVVSGSVIYLRTIDEYMFNSKTIPANTLIEGTVALSSSRLHIIVETIRVESKTVANKLFAYDMHGTKGLAVNLGVENDIANDALNTGIEEASRALNVPVISQLVPSSAKKMANAPTVEINKGGKFYLKQ